MSESQGGGQPGSSGSPADGGQSKNSSEPDNVRPLRNTGQSGYSGQPRGNSQPGGRSQPNRSDPVADFQRWLMKAGAKSMANQVADQVKRTLGQERRTSGDVWDTATTESPPNEPPECQWCPVCQAARAARLGSQGGLSARLADAGGVLASVVQDAFSAFEQVMKNQEQNRTAERPGSSASRTPSPDRGETRP